MTYYHPTKEAALEAGKARFGDRWCVNAQMESYNGWVIILSPLTLDYLKEPLEPILAFAEIQIRHTIRRRPADYKAPPKVSSSESTSRSERRRRRRGRDKPVSAPVAPPPPPSRPTGAVVAPPPQKPPSELEKSFEVLLPKTPPPPPPKRP